MLPRRVRLTFAGTRAKARDVRHGAFVALGARATAVHTGKTTIGLGRRDQLVVLMRSRGKIRAVTRAASAG
jgi:hypothetical protein